MAFVEIGICRNWYSEKFNRTRHDTYLNDVSCFLGREQFQVEGHFFRKLKGVTIADGARNNRRRGSGPRGVRWCWTINNPTKAERPAWREDAMEYHVYQLEQGEQGTPHWQGFTIFKERQRLAGVKRLIGDRCHAELAEYSNKHCADYCKKSQGHIDGPWEFGKLDEASTQGKRTDLAKVVKAVMERKSMRDVVEEFPNEAVKYLKNLKEIRALVKPPPRDHVDVFVLYGPTGTGKTFAAHLHWPELFRPIIAPGRIWWDGYEDEDVILLDEFDGHGKDSVPIAHLLQLLDPYPLKIEVKGSSTWARWTTVIITSNYPPVDWYDVLHVGQPRILALERRCKHVIHFVDREAANCQINNLLTVPLPMSLSQ